MGLDLAPPDEVEARRQEHRRDRVKRRVDGRQKGDSGQNRSPP